MEIEKFKVKKGAIFENYYKKSTIVLINDN